MPLRRDAGFTLIELLVVTATISILAMVAIPQYASFRARGIDAKVASAVRHAATGEEEFYITHYRYSDDVNELSGLVLDRIEITLSAGNSGDLSNSFRIRGSHPLGSREYEWVSDPEPDAPNFIELASSD